MVLGGLLLLVVGVLAALTLGPLPKRALDLTVQLLAAVTPGPGGPSKGAVERVGNVLLFVPLGLLLALLLPRARAVALVAVLAGVSLAVEVVQATLLQGRYPTPRDVVLNSLGAVLGVAAGRLVLRLRRLRA